MPLEASSTAAMKALAEGCRAMKESASASTVQSPYRELVRNSIIEAIERAYPIAHALLSCKSDDWNILMDRFLSERQLRHPQLWRMPSELCEYVELTPGMFPQYPFLLDLLRFEWMEIEVFMAPDPEAAPCPPHLLRLNSTRRVLALQYPVFDPAKFGTWQSGTFFLLCLRNLKSDEVSYSEVSSSTARILQRLPLDEIRKDELPTLFAMDSAILPGIDECLRSLESWGVLVC